MVIDMNFLKQIAFFRKKTPTKVRKLVSFKDKTSTEYKAALTIKKVLVREGISSETSATMEPFTGNN